MKPMRLCYASILIMPFLNPRSGRAGRPNELLAERVVVISNIALLDVEGVPVVRSERNAMLGPEDQIGVGDVVAAKCNADIPLAVFPVQCLRGSVRHVATGNKDRGLVVPLLEKELEVLLLVSEGLNIVRRLLGNN